MDLNSVTVVTQDMVYVLYVMIGPYNRGGHTL